MNYQELNCPKNDGGVESVDVSVGDEATNNREQESWAHQICESVCSGWKIEIQLVHEVEHQAHHVRHETHIFQRRQTYTRIILYAYVV